MENIVIEADNLSKKYNIVHLEQGFVTLRDKLAGVLRHPAELFKNLKSKKKEDFWALRDISFSIKAGEMVGLIGGNGSGKSTLLKVLSRITPPSAGQAKIHGRVASLLEVGTGFHPELTGRENIFLNGAILGMTKKNIVNRFDEIVEFSGVVKFLDTPVKRYSSGMYVRLAFAVAAHMDSDILFIDEVLAVGDAEFQKKCLGKIDKLVQEQKRTILFVTHNLSTIKALCPRSILLVGGRMAADGPTSEVLEKYLDSKPVNFKNQLTFANDETRPASLRSLTLTTESGQVSNLFKCDQRIVINFSCQINRPSSGLHGYLAIKDSYGSVIMESVSHDDKPNPLSDLSRGRYDFCLSIPSRSLAAGHYNLCLTFFSGNLGDFGEVESLCGLELIDEITPRGNDRNGFFSTILNWERI